MKHNTHHDDQRRWRWRRSIKQTHPQLFLTSTFYMRLLRVVCHSGRQGRATGTGVDHCTAMSRRWMEMYGDSSGLYTGTPVSCWNNSMCWHGDDEDSLQPPIICVLFICFKTPFPTERQSRKDSTLMKNFILYTKNCVNSLLTLY